MSIFSCFGSLCRNFCSFNCFSTTYVIGEVSSREDSTGKGGNDVLKLINTYRSGAKTFVSTLNEIQAIGNISDFLQLTYSTLRGRTKNTKDQGLIGGAIAVALECIAKCNVPNTVRTVHPDEAWARVKFATRAIKLDKLCESENPMGITKRQKQRIDSLVNKCIKYGSLAEQLWEIVKLAFDRKINGFQDKMRALKKDTLTRKQYRILRTSLEEDPGYNGASLDSSRVSFLQDILLNTSFVALRDTTKAVFMEAAKHFNSSFFNSNWNNFCTWHAVVGTKAIEEVTEPHTGAFGYRVSVGGEPTEVYEGSPSYIEEYKQIPFLHNCILILANLLPNPSDNISDKSYLSSIKSIERKLSLNDKSRLDDYNIGRKKLEAILQRMQLSLDNMHKNGLTRRQEEKIAKKVRRYQSSEYNGAVYYLYHTYKDAVHGLTEAQKRVEDNVSDAFKQIIGRYDPLFKLRLHNSPNLLSLGADSMFKLLKLAKSLTPFQRSQYQKDFSKNSWDK